MAPLRLIVFDLDETLGHFSQLSAFIGAIRSATRKTLPLIAYCHLYPEVFRPGIFKCLADLVQRIKLGENLKVILYTNNCGPPAWAREIVQCANSILQFPLFTHVIPGHIGPGSRRTTLEKTLPDLVRCVDLPPMTKICFVDDAHHPGMVHDKVYYIRVRPYISPLRLDTMIERCYQQLRPRMEFRVFHNSIVKSLTTYNVPWAFQSATPDDDRMNELLLYNHLQIFLDS